MTRSRSLALIALFTLPVLTISACAVPSAGTPAGSGPATSQPTQSQPEASWRAEMLASVNAERALSGANPLVHCAALDRAAQAHSDDQAAHNKMTHTGSNGSNAGQRIAAAGYGGVQGWGENVAVGYPTVGAVMSGWMNSPGHRANIMNPSYRHVGLGMATSAPGSPYWTQNFGYGGGC